MSAISIQKMADRVAEMMRSNLGLKGRRLDDMLRRSSGKVPRNVVRAASELSRAADMAQNPKLLMQMNSSVIARYYDTCVKHLAGAQRWQRRRAWAESWLLSVMTSLGLLGALVAALLYWRGFL